MPRGARRTACRARRVLACLVAVCALAAPVDATVVVPVDFATVVTEATTIVHGRVAEVRSELVGPARTIESVVKVEVVESLKGADVSTVTFRVPNGQVGRFRRIVVGAPEFEAGDEVVLFLKGRPPAMPILVGLGQGVYRVARSGSRAMVLPPLVAGGPGAVRVTRGDPRRRPVPVETFVRDVAAILEEAR